MERSNSAPTQCPDSVTKQTIIMIIFIRPNRNENETTTRASTHSTRWHTNIELIVAELVTNRANKPNETNMCSESYSIRAIQFVVRVQYGFSGCFSHKCATPLLEEGSACTHNKLPVITSNICDEMLGVWPNAHSNRRCTANNKEKKTKRNEQRLAPDSLANSGTGWITENEHWTTNNQQQQQKPHPRTNETYHLYDMRLFSFGEYELMLRGE